MDICKYCLCQYIIDSESNCPSWIIQVDYDDISFLGEEEFCNCPCHLYGSELEGIYMDAFEEIYGGK